MTLPLFILQYSLQDKTMSGKMKVSFQGFGYGSFFLNNVYIMIELIITFIIERMDLR